MWAVISIIFTLLGILTYFRKTFYISFKRIMIEENAMEVLFQRNSSFQTERLSEFLLKCRFILKFLSHPFRPLFWRLKFFLSINLLLCSSFYRSTKWTLFQTVRSYFLLLLIVVNEGVTWDSSRNNPLNKLDNIFTQLKLKEICNLYELPTYRKAY